MKVIVLVLNEDGDPHFKSEEDFRFDGLLEIAKEKEPMARDYGAEWTKDAITFFGAQVLKAVNQGENRELTEATIQMVIASLLFDSIFCAVCTDDFRHSELNYTIYANGVVAYTRNCVPYS